MPSACSPYMPVSLQLFHRALEVPVHNIKPGILETPGSDRQGIAFSDPGPFLHGSLDPAHAGDPARPPHTAMICSHHPFSTGWQGIPAVRTALTTPVFSFLVFSLPSQAGFPGIRCQGRCIKK